MLITAQTWFILWRPWLRRPHATEAVMHDRLGGSIRPCSRRFLALGTAFFEPAWGLFTLLLMIIIDRVPFLRRIG